MSVQLGADATSTSVAELKALGAVFVCRYLSPENVGAWKNLTLAEANALKAGGVDIVSNWELDTTDWESGQGTSYAQQAEAQHLACGGPAGAPIYFSVDMDADATAVVNSGYFQSINGVIGAGRTGVYGSTAVCTALKAAGLVTYTWRTMSTDFAGGYGVESDFNIEQTGYFNSNYDRDASITVDYGQWSAHGGVVTNPVPNPVASAGNYQSNASHNTHTPLVVDGYFGTASWKALQAVLFGSNSSEVDGSAGPVTLTALQEMLANYHGAALAHDGVLTPGGNTIKSIQEKAGATQDGYWGTGTSEAVQRALNTGTFWGSN